MKFTLTQFFTSNRIGHLMINRGSDKNFRRHANSHLTKNYFFNLQNYFYSFPVLYFAFKSFGFLLAFGLLIALILFYRICLTLFFTEQDKKKQD